MSDQNPCCQHPACLSGEDLASQCQFTRTRRGGPGGQHRNKVESAIVVTHVPTGITGQASERRSQHENRTVALQRLRLNLAIAWRNPEAPTGISQLWSERCPNGKIMIGVAHRDFPCILAEALDWIVISNFQMAVAAESLRCSTSQLIKLIKSAESAFQWVNRQRKLLDMGPLK